MGFELILPPIPPKPQPKKKGCFVKGHTPWNKGMSKEDFFSRMSPEALERCLQSQRKMGERMSQVNRGRIALNRKKVVAIKDGKFYVFDSLTQCGKVIGSNIKSVSDAIRNNHRCRNYKLFYESDDRWITYYKQQTI